LAEELVGRLGEKLGVRLGESEVKILKMILTDKYISAKKLSANIGISLTAIENNIAKLKKKDVLRRIGPDKGGYWEVVTQKK
jgi:ATP-dependent DNA helicase RecG